MDKSFWILLVVYSTTSLLTNCWYTATSPEYFSSFDEYSWKSFAWLIWASWVAILISCWYLTDCSLKIFNLFSTLDLYSFNWVEILDNSALANSTSSLVSIWVTALENDTTKAGASYDGALTSSIFTNVVANDGVEGDTGGVAVILKFDIEGAASNTNVGADSNIDKSPIDGIGNKDKLTSE